MTVHPAPLKALCVPLCLSLAALATSQWAAAGELRLAQPELPHAALAHIEAHYADWLDATGAVGTIDSGLTTRIDGLDRETWYMINYGLGAVLTADIRRRTGEAIGSFDAGNARWYQWTSKHLLRYGASLDTATLLRQFLGRPVSTQALLSQLRRLD